MLEPRPERTLALPLSPGQMPVHYAPRTPAYHVGSLEELAGFALPENFALIVIGEHRGARELPGSAQFVLESPDGGLAGALRRACTAAMRSRRPRSSWCFRPTSPNGGPCATA